jgi:predicted Zn-dependent peptidase
MAIRSDSANGTYQKTTLRNGIRVITETVPGVRSISLGIWIDVGSRSERPAENGITHMIEHMFFKGTKKRTPKQIAASLESIGGNLNAFTSREQTCFTARILDEHLPVAVEVLADMLKNSTLTEENIAREKMVICEEIKEAEETPTDRVHDLFANAFWGGQPLGRPVLGTKESVTSLTRHSLVDYIKRNYRSKAIVVAAAGSVSHRKLVALAQKHFRFGEGPAEVPQLAVARGLRTLDPHKDDIEQVHLCLGFPGVNYGSRDKVAALALNAHLGGGMSSVLFQKIREDKGLAYSVYCFNDFYRDAGMFGTYVGTDATKVEQAVGIIMDEFALMKTQKLSTSKLNNVKAQLKGQLTLGMESTTAKMNRLGRLELMLGKYHSVKDTLKEIDALTAKQVLELANRFFDSSKLTVTALGPVDLSFLNAT